MELLFCILLMAGILILPTRINCVLKQSEFQKNIASLTKHFFANLQEDLRLKDNILSDSSKTFIDKQLENYMALIRQTHGLFEHSVTRRSLPIEDITTITRDYIGVYRLDGFVPLFNIKAYYPRDIVLFQRDEQWYAAALECKQGKNMADDLVIYKTDIYKQFSEFTRGSVTNGVKLGVLSTSESTYIVVAENNAPSNKIHEKTGIFEFVPYQGLRKIQSLNTAYASDVVLWEEQHDIFMAVSQNMINSNGQIVYEIDIPIYKWLGKHFDIINHIKTYGVRRITPFVIGNSHFLAVANFQDNSGNTNIYSEIFKYNMDTDKFETYQRVLTKAAVDVKYFCFKLNNVKENFLIFANFFDTKKDGSPNYETESIVYKYVDNYFIPFQSFKLTAAMEWLPITGPNEEFALLVACKYEGIKAFQYDGWKFVVSQVQYTNEAFSKGVVSMHSYHFDEKAVVVIANENDQGNMMDIFRPIFTHQNTLGKFHDDTLLWCKQNLESYQALDFRTIKKKVDAAPKHEDSVLQLAQSLTFNNVTIENLHTFEPNTTDLEEDEEELNKLAAEVSAYSEELNEIEQQVNLSLHTTGKNVFIGNVYVQKLILNKSDSFLDFLTTTTINDMEVSAALENVIDINKGFVVENPFVFDNITAENEIFPKFVNHQPFDALVNQNPDQYFYDVIIDGDAAFDNVISVHGKVNGINFTKDNVLLKKGDQALSNLQVNTLAAEKIDATFVNNIEMSQMNSQNNEKVLLENIKNLNAKTVFIEGLINNVDVPTLNRYALRTFGNQTITKEYIFDSLYVDTINVKNISNKNIPEDLILIDTGNYMIVNDVHFVNELSANTVIVTEHLNTIKVVNGQLDVLLADVAQVQHITGYKELENLELLNPIKLQGRINSSRLNSMNPVAIIDDEIVLTGDYIISGDVKIEEFLQANDLQSNNLGDITNLITSVRRLQEKGIKITESTIPVHIDFSQPLNIQELFTDRINDVEVSSMVVTGTNEQQIITGWKKFLNDVHILGPTKLDNVNGINLQDLELGVLKVNGEQTLSGKYHFENIIANRINNVKTDFGGVLWENIVTTYGDQQIAGTTLIENSVKANILKSDVINCNQINGYDFTSLINDTVFHGRKLQLINGYTEFADLLVENLNVPDFDLERLSKIIESANGTFTFDEDVDLPEDIIIENIVFTDKLNDISSERFGEQWLASGSELIIHSDQHFNKITILDNLFIISGLMNNIDIKAIREYSVKIDEDFHFASVTFSNGLVSLVPVSLSGQFESLDLNDVVQSHTKFEQILSDQIIFNGDVTIFGEVFFNGLICGLNLTGFCEFAFPLDNEVQKNLHVNGNIYFAMGPEAYYINNRPVRQIVENIWFTDREALIIGVMEFNEVLFQEDVIVHGFVDDIKVQLIAQTYFSKTRDQNISALLEFDGSVFFSGGVYAKTANVEGDVCGINLEEFTSTALLDNYLQIFENTIYLEECEVQKLDGDYLVNDLNLQTDVMRYDTANVVTGKKIVDTVQTNMIWIDEDMDKRVKIQDVEILWWMEHCVLKTGTFRISGFFVFNNHTTFWPGLRSRDSLVNGKIFNQETVMLKSVPQAITGNKAFVQNTSQPLRFKSMKLNGLLNEVDMADLMYHQVYKNRDTIFESPIQFTAEIATPNVNVARLYQGVDVTALISNITQSSFINNYYNSFERLLNVSYNARESLTVQPFFLDYYQVRQIYRMIDIIEPVTFDGSDVQYLACIIKSTHNYSIQLDTWDEETEYFHGDNKIAVMFPGKQLHYLKAVTFKGKDNWYIEHENIDTETKPTISSKYESSIYKILPDGLIKTLPSILHNGTKSVVSVMLPDENVNKDCLFVLFEENAVLYCEIQDSGNNYLDIYQLFDTYNGIAVATSLVQDTPYIFVINRGTIQEQPNVVIWKFDKVTKLFNIEQMIYVASPDSITTAFYQGHYYLVIASGHIQNTKYAGILNIRRLDESSQKFITWQDISINAPLQVELVELPTNELVLYVLTDNPTEPLIIYEYAGISGFREKIVASTIPKATNMRSFTTKDHKHFILVQNVNETRVIEAVLKGIAKPYDDF